MSHSYRIWRQRWAARTMILKRWWITTPARVEFGAPICDLEVDGQLVTVANHDDEHLTWGIYWPYLSEGDEVGPGAELFEYSYDGRIPRNPLTYDPRPRALAYRHRKTHPTVFLSY